MRRIFLGLLLLSGFFPMAVYAAVCDIKNYTVVYTNGILTARDEADSDAKKLQDAIGYSFKNETITVRVGYNPSHLAGAGDLYKSIQQAMQKETPTVVEDFDLKTILMQIQPQVTTRKILLVGHSQGTFYTNSIYRYLLENGAPEKSVAVYNLATPAYYVEGGGNYLTSSNDRLIEKVRKWTSGAGVTAPLPANITIPLPANEINSESGGHHFSSSYLAMEPERIVADITSALNKLKAGDTATDGCFTPPSPTISYKTQSAVFSVADPVSRAGADAASATGRAISAAAKKTYAAATRIQNAIANVFKTFELQGNLVRSQGALAVTATIDSPQAPAETPVIHRGAALVDALVTENASEISAPPISEAPSPPEEAKEDAPQAPEIIETINKTQTPSIPIIPMLSIAPGFGGGGPAPAAASGNAQSASAPAAPATIILPFAIISPAENAVFATTTISFTGTTTLSAVVSASYATTTATTTASGTGDWSFTFALQEGTTTVSFVSSNNAGESSATEARTVSVDLTPPSAPTLTIKECSFSLATTTCFIAATTVTASWNSVSDASYYGLAKNGALVATTTATTAASIAGDNATTTFAVVAYDAAGNSATSTAKSAQVMTLPIVINEIAWAGTGASDSDEWLELKNLSGYTLDMSHLAVASVDGSPYIQLTGLLVPTGNPTADGYYLIERRLEATSKSENLVSAFDQLGDTGEELLLQWGSGVSTTTIDRTPAAATCAGWCAGSAASTTGFSPQFGTTTAKLSMERIGTALGSLASSWANNDLYIRDMNDAAADASGVIINGTPKLANSAHLPNSGWYCGSDSPIVAGGTYRPSSGLCTYLSAFINTQAIRFGSLYKGTLGSSTVVNGHSLGKAIKNTQSNDDIPSGTASGQQFFVALWEQRSGPAFNDDTPSFNAYFTTASTTGAVTTPPHDNYRIIPWIYAP